MSVQNVGAVHQPKIRRAVVLSAVCSRSDGSEAIPGTCYHRHLVSNFVQVTCKAWGRIIHGWRNREGIRCALEERGLGRRLAGTHALILKKR